MDFTYQMYLYPKPNTTGFFLYFSQPLTILFAIILKQAYDSQVYRINLHAYYNKNMNKYIYTLLAFIFIGFTSSAQKSTFSANDPDAKKILDAVSKNYKSYTTYQADFTFKVENAAGQVQSTKPGTIKLKGQKYRMNLNGQDFISDGINLWTYDKGAKEVTINRFDNKSSTLTPQKLFTDFYTKDFLYTQNEDTKLNGKAVQEIELTPTDKTKPYFKVLLWISNNTVQGAKIFEKAGNRFSYVINTAKTNTTIADTEFGFNAANYPGVEVIDLR